MLKSNTLLTLVAAIAGDDCITSETRPVASAVPAKTFVNFPNIGISLSLAFMVFPPRHGFFIDGRQYTTGRRHSCDGQARRTVGRAKFVSETGNASILDTRRMRKDVRWKSLRLALVFFGS